MAKIGKITPRQRKVLEFAQVPGFDRTISQICRESDVPLRTFYNWLKQPEFVEEWDKVWGYAIHRHMPGVVSAMLEKARKGDTAAARLVSELAQKIIIHHEVDGFSIDEWLQKREERLKQIEVDNS